MYVQKKHWGEKLSAIKLQGIIVLVAVIVLESTYSGK